MGKATKIFLSVMLVVGILVASILLTPWVPVGNGLWSPLDVMMYDGDIEEFGKPEPAEMPAGESYGEPAGELAEEPAAELAEEPAEEHFGPAVVSDVEWENLALRAEISTMEQAIEYFNTRFPDLIMGVYCADDRLDYYWIENGYTQCLNPSDWVMDRAAVVNGITYLLSDNMEIYTVIGFRHIRGQIDPYGMPVLAINCIKTEDGYAFIDPVKGMQGDISSRRDAILPEATVSSIEEYVHLINSDPQIYSTLDFLYMFEGGTRIEYYVDEQGISTLRYPMQKSVYQNLDKDMSAMQREAKAHIKPENIDKYQLSRVLGGTTLTPEQAYGLVYAKPEEVKAAVKTAGDLLMYMLAAQIGDVGMCNCDQWGEYVWHSNLTAKEVMSKKRANCGSSANLANYLLEGDYEEVGIIQHAYYKGNGGGHVYNYFLYEGKYYIVDFSWFISRNYAPSADFPVMALKSLEDYNGKLANKLFRNVSLVIAFTSTGQHLPNVFGEDYNEDPYHYYVPEGAEYTVLYEAGDGYLIAEKPLDKRHHDWTVYWPGYQAP